MKNTKWKFIKKIGSVILPLSSISVLTSCSISDFTGFEIKEIPGFRLKKSKTPFIAF